VSTSRGLTSGLPHDDDGSEEVQAQAAHFALHHLVLGVAVVQAAVRGQARRRRGRAVRLVHAVVMAHVHPRRVAHLVVAAEARVGDHVMAHAVVRGGVHLVMAGRVLTVAGEVVHVTVVGAVVLVGAVAGGRAGAGGAPAEGVVGREVLLLLLLGLHLLLLVRAHTDVGPGRQGRAGRRHGRRGAVAAAQRRGRAEGRALGQQVLAGAHLLLDDGRRHRPRHGARRRRRLDDLRLQLDLDCGTAADAALVVVRGRVVVVVVGVVRGGHGCRGARGRACARSGARPAP